MPVTPRISALVEPDRGSLDPSALAAPANATAALHSAAPRITFFMMPPLFLKITDDVAELVCATGDYVVVQHFGTGFRTSRIIISGTVKVVLRNEIIRQTNIR